MTALREPKSQSDGTGRTITNRAGHNPDSKIRDLRHAASLEKSYSERTLFEANPEPDSCRVYRE